MIVRVSFADGLVVLFGNSYKRWTIQFDEFCWRFKAELPDIISVHMSNSKWISWGGLKWCNESLFQNNLDHEECQENEPNNPRPRLYAEMDFESNDKVEKIARLILQDCKNSQTNAKLVYFGKLPKGV